MCVKVDGDLITQEFFPNYVGREELINAGLCYKWAYAAICIFPNVTLWSNESHAWVEQDGKFFDSESPNGEKRLEYLNCNSRCGRGERESWQVSSMDEFVDYWEENGRYGFNDEDEWKRKIKNFRRRQRRRELKEQRKAA